MSRNCTYLDIHDHHVSNGAWLTGALLRRSWKTSAAKNPTIVMALSEQVLPHYLLKSLTNNARALYLSMTTYNDEHHHLIGSSLEVVMDKFSVLAFPNCHDFMFYSKQFVLGWMGTMDKIMMLKVHSTSKYNPPSINVTPISVNPL